MYKPEEAKVLDGHSINNNESTPWADESGKIEPPLEANVEEGEATTEHIENGTVAAMTEDKLVRHKTESKKENEKGAVSVGVDPIPHED